MIRPAQTIALPQEAIRPYFIAHIIQDVDEKCQYLYLDTDQKSDEMIVEVSPNGVRVAWTQALRERLLKLNSTLKPTLIHTWDVD